MSIRSIYQNITEQKIKVNASEEPPPIINSDVSQYANILAKKSYLNKDSLIREAAPVQQPVQQSAPAQPITQQKPNILQLAQSVGQKFSNAPEPTRTLVANILNSLLK
jgi:hypothetical protein